MLLYKSLQLSGSMRPEDTFIVVCDAATATHLQQIPLLKGIGLAVVRTPQSLKDGMSLKYLLRSEKDEFHIYLDADMLIRKPIRPVLDPDTLCVFPEGRADDTNYCGKTEALLTLPAGFTAGFFAYRPGKRVYEFFDAILNDLKRGGETFYTLDQPYFNHHLVGKRVQIFPKTYVSFNGHGMCEATHIVNLAGDPGDGEFHLTKQLAFFLSGLSGSQS